MLITALVDATSIPANTRGLGRYLLDLISALAKRDDLRLVVPAQSRDAAMWTKAMAWGTAVVTTRRLARPDVAIYAEHDRTDLERALRETLLDVHNRMQRPDRASAFTWQRSAERHLEAFRLAAETTR